MFIEKEDYKIPEVHRTGMTFKVDQQLWPTRIHSFMFTEPCWSYEPQISTGISYAINIARLQRF
jgi:hypothetical protein